MYNYAKILLSKERGSAESILLIFGIVMVFMVVGNLIGLAFTFFIIDFDLKSVTNFNETLLHSKNGWWAMMINLGVSSIITFVFSGLFYWILIEKKSCEDLIFNKFPSASIFLLILLSQLLFVPINTWFENINQKMVLPEGLKSLQTIIRSLEDSMKEITEFLMNFTSIPQLIIAIFVIGVLAGVGEELVFRGLLQRKLYRATKNIHVAIWLSAIIFSAIHFQFYGFVPRMLLGAMFGYFYYWSGNIWVPIICHSLNNALAVLLTYLINIKTISPEYEKMEEFPVSVILCSLVLFSGITYLIKTKSASNVASTNEIQS